MFFINDYYCIVEFKNNNSIRPIYKPFKITHRVRRWNGPYVIDKKCREKKAFNLICGQKTNEIKNKEKVQTFLSNF